MPNFLFWNTRNQPIEALIARMATDAAMDIVVLAESVNLHRSKLLNLLNAVPQGFRFHSAQESRLILFTRYPSKAVQRVSIERSDDNGLTFWYIQPPGFDSFLLATAHLASKLHLKTEDQQQLCPRYAGYVREAEIAVGHQRTVLVGDLNMNPFEYGVVGCEGFHGVMTRHRALKRHRTFKGEMRSFFYNPMWSLIGDRVDGPPGTYHSSRGGPVEYFWHTFDQVMVRPDLLDGFDESQVRILDEGADLPLITKSGFPNRKAYSDHLPITFTLQLPLEDKS